ncbi:MAG: thioredoxin family protein [Burkholderiales bacterium]
MAASRRLLLRTGAVLASAVALVGGAWVWRRANRPRPYDEHADARAQLAQARGIAQAQGKHVLVIFGANWCSYCQALDRTMKTAGLLSQHLATGYAVVKVDVGDFNRNMDLDRELGRPARKGIPAMAVLSATGQLLRAVDGIALTRAQNRGEARLVDAIEGRTAAGT